MNFARTSPTAVCILCHCILLILSLFSLRHSSLLSTRNVGHFVLLLLFSSYQCGVICITCSKCWSFGFVLAVFICPYYHCFVGLFCSPQQVGSPLLIPSLYSTRRYQFMNSNACQICFIQYQI